MAEKPVHTLMAGELLFYDGPDANIIRESSAAADSFLMSTLRQKTIRSEVVVAHIRKASQGQVTLKKYPSFQTGTSRICARIRT